MNGRRMTFWGEHHPSLNQHDFSSRSQEMLWWVIGSEYTSLSYFRSKFWRSKHFRKSNVLWRRTFKSFTDEKSFGENKALILNDTKLAFYYILIYVQVLKKGTICLNTYPFEKYYRLCKLANLATLITNFLRRPFLIDLLRGTYLLFKLQQSYRLLEIISS